MIDNGRFFKPIGWSRLKKRIDKRLKESEKWIAKYNAKKSTSIKNPVRLP